MTSKVYVRLTWFLTCDLGSSVGQIRPTSLCVKRLQLMPPSLTSRQAHVGYTQRLISSYEKLSHLSYKLIIGLLVSGYAVSEVDPASLWWSNCVLKWLAGGMSAIMIKSSLPTWLLPRAAKLWIILGLPTPRRFDRTIDVHGTPIWTTLGKMCNIACVSTLCGKS